MNNIQWATQWGFSFIIVTGIDIYSCIALSHLNLCETLVCAEYLLNANWKPRVWVWGKMYFQDTKCHRMWVNEHELGMSSCMMCSWTKIAKEITNFWSVPVAHLGESVLHVLRLRPWQWSRFYYNHLSPFAECCIIYLSIPHFLSM